MLAITETTFVIKNSGFLNTFLSWRIFSDDRDVLNSLEDYLFWKIIEKSDKWDFCKESEVF